MRTVVPVRPEPQSVTSAGSPSGDRTETTSTDRTPKGDSERAPVAAIAVVLACDRPALGGSLHPVQGVRRLVIGRGKRGVAFSVSSSGEARLEVPDGKASRDHAAVEIDGSGVRLCDLGSTNGTYLEEEAIRAEPLAPGSFFRVGHTIFQLVADAGPAVERQARTAAPWPFLTLSSELSRRLDRLERIAPSQLPILISGETGAGKERIARAVHEKSRRPGSFIAVNCGAIPANLVESHLFGHKKGAFSGALQDEPGFVRAADQGTVFLDEVGDLPLVAQASLLRVLQEGEVVPVGASYPIRVDIRVLCATHRPLLEMVRAGTFREDLYARLAAFTFELIPLRQRIEDLGVLVASLLKSPTPPFPRDIRFHTDAAMAMARYDWPRNVRELMHTVQSAAMLAAEGVVRPEDLPAAFHALHATSDEPPPAGGASRPLDPEDVALRDELARRLAANGGNLAAVGREMGKARQQIQRWKRRFGLP